MPTVQDHREGESGQTTKKPRLDGQRLPTRQYLDQSVVPVVLRGLAAVAKDRPADPLEFLANFLLKNRPSQQQEHHQQQHQQQQEQKSQLQPAASVETPLGDAPAAAT